MPVLKLFVLYDESEPLPVPDVKDRNCTLKLAAVAIFMHLDKKAQVILINLLGKQLSRQYSQRPKSEHVRISDDRL